MYHDIVLGYRGANPYILDIDEFVRHMEYLSSNHYRSLLPDHLIKDLTGISVHTKSLIITFDDSNKSYYEIVFPVLMKYGFKAVFFINTSCIDCPDCLTWRNLREMRESGMSIQSHGHHHVFLTDLARVGLNDELSESKSLIETKLGFPVDFISFPGGRFNKSILDRVKGAGYKGVFTSIPSSRQRFDRGLYIFNRYLITSDISQKGVEFLVTDNAFYMRKNYFKYRLAGFLKTLLGNRLYHLIWTVVVKGGPDDET